MAEQQGLPEAPVSWTVRYRSTQGYDCMLTLRGTDAAAVLRQAHSLMEAMRSAGAGPTGAMGPMGPASAAGPAATTGPAAPAGNGGHNSSGPAQQGPGWCAAHGVQMRRYERNGAAWYAHQTAEGHWCHGHVVKVGATHGGGDAL